jgi:hypothetical protein
MACPSSHVQKRQILYVANTSLFLFYRLESLTILLEMASPSVPTVVLLYLHIDLSGRDLDSLSSQGKILAYEPTPTSKYPATRKNIYWAAVFFFCGRGYIDARRLEAVGTL